jgi:protein PhnA
VLPSRICQNVIIVEKVTDMSELPPCPKCESPYTYEDGDLLICPECAHEWSLATGQADAIVVRDSNGTPLADGDTVSVIKDLKVKGSSAVVKVGTKVKGIRLVDGDHDIDCKIPGIGQMGLKSEFVKKVVE